MGDTSGPPAVAEPGAPGSSRDLAVSAGPEGGALLVADRRPRRWRRGSDTPPHSTLFATASRLPSPRSKMTPIRATDAHGEHPGETRMTTKPRVWAHTDSSRGGSHVRAFHCRSRRLTASSAPRKPTSGTPSGSSPARTTSRGRCSRPRVRSSPTSTPEGYPGARYYQGQVNCDALETLAIERAKALFGAEHANVQPYSGSPANLAVYLAFLAPGDTILGLDLSHGGHLTHGSRASITRQVLQCGPLPPRREDGTPRLRCHPTPRPGAQAEDPGGRPFGLPTAARLRALPAHSG